MTPQDQQQQNIQSIGASAVREQDKIQLVLAWLPLVCLIPLLTVKDSEFVKWNAKQGLVLTVVIPLLCMIPVVGWILACPLNLAWLVIMILGITKSLKGERFPIPLVSDLASKF
jgi:uncharacterized membrane protein